jgi:hypothetical protein
MSDETYADRQLALVHSLYSRTKDGKVDWKETNYSLSFEAPVGGYIFKISLVPDQDYPNEPDYQLQVRENDTKSQRWIDTISNATLRPVSDKITPDGLNPYGVLGRIYELARRKALHVEDALERILATLNGV